MGRRADAERAVRFGGSVREATGMCGIAGIVNLDGAPVEAEKLLAMGMVAVHRGPDGRGEWVEGVAGLAHRRLSIIDISGGAQPMVSHDGRYVISYNGEMYNYRELKRDYLGDYPYRTMSDTEVVLAAFCKWGAGCLGRFNGIFAFAVWDRRDKVLFLARDQFGVKPLYYALTGRAMLFASEIKSILAADTSLARLSLKNLDTALTYRFSPSPNTLFEKIKKIMPGHFVTLADGILEEKRYFLPAPSAAAQEEGELLPRLATRMEEAVGRQLVAEVPVGVLLSGGVDSSLVAALAAKKYGGQMTAFTVGFEGNNPQDEIKDAAVLAAHLGMRHEALEVAQPDFLPVLERVVYHLEEPAATSSAVPLFMLCEAIGRTHKVVLSGQGADEQWAGYLRHLGEGFASALGPVFASQSLRSLADMLPRARKLKQAFASLGETDDEMRYAKERFLFDSTSRKNLLLTAFPDDMAHIRYFSADTVGMDPLQKALYLDTRTQLADDLLLYTDKVSMAHSVEVRVPFLDVGLASFVEALPSNLKLRGFSRKHLFKKAAALYLPEYVLKRKKAGFETPIDLWFRSEMSGAVRDTLCGATSLSGQLFTKGAVEGMTKKQADGREDYSRQLFMLLSLELWMRRFKVSV